LFSSEDPLAFKCRSGGRIYLKATQNFHIGPDLTPGREGEFKVFTDYYAYTVSESETLETELCAWHWHPGAQPRPHLHIGAPVAHDRSFHKLHLPTGRVLFEDVLCFLIEEFDVKPRKKNWDAILGDVVNRVKLYWTWA
jgi:hypothetical protein